MQGSSKCLGSQRFCQSLNLSDTWRALLSSFERSLTLSTLFLAPFSSLWSDLPFSYAASSSLSSFLFFLLSHWSVDADVSQTLKGRNPSVVLADAFLWHLINDQGTFLPFSFIFPHILPLFILSISCLVSIDIQVCMQSIHPCN